MAELGRCLQVRGMEAETLTAGIVTPVNGLDGARLVDERSAL